MSVVEDGDVSFLLQPNNYLSIMLVLYGRFALVHIAICTTQSNCCILRKFCWRRGGEELNLDNDAYPKTHVEECGSDSPSGRRRMVVEEAPYIILQQNRLQGGERRGSGAISKESNRLMHACNARVYRNQWCTNSREREKIDRRSKRRANKMSNRRQGKKIIKTLGSINMLHATPPYQQIFALLWRHISCSSPYLLVHHIQDEKFNHQKPHLPGWCTHQPKAKERNMQDNVSISMISTDKPLPSLSGVGVERHWRTWL